MWSAAALGIQPPCRGSSGLAPACSGCSDGHGTQRPLVTAPQAGLVWFVGVFSSQAICVWLVWHRTVDTRVDSRARNHAACGRLTRKSPLSIEGAFSCSDRLLRTSARLRQKSCQPLSKPVPSATRPPLQPRDARDRERKFAPRSGRRNPGEGLPLVRAGQYVPDAPFFPSALASWSVDAEKRGAGVVRAATRRVHGARGG